jgi:hypothetical protein
MAMNPDFPQPTGRTIPTSRSPDSRLTAKAASSAFWVRDFGVDELQSVDTVF